MPDKTVSPRNRRRSVRIVSGANVPQIDLDAMFRRSPNPDSLTAAGRPTQAAAMTGGGAQVQVAASNQNAEPRSKPTADSVNLSDGTNITFAAPDWMAILELM